MRQSFAASRSGRFFEALEFAEERHSLVINFHK
jgi:hypothetical protein